MQFRYFISSSLISLVKKFYKREIIKSLHAILDCLIKDIIFTCKKLCKSQKKQPYACARSGAFQSQLLEFSNFFAQCKPHIQHCFNAAVGSQINILCRLKHSFLSKLAFVNYTELPYFSVQILGSCSGWHHHYQYIFLNQLSLKQDLAVSPLEYKNYDEFIVCDLFSI